MAEFALVVPVFLLLVVGLLVFGRLFFYWIETNHLANETARWAVVDNNPYDASCPGGPYTGLAGCQSLQQHARSSATNEFEDNVVVCVQAFHPDTGVLVALDDAKVGYPIKVKVQVPVAFGGFFDFGGITIRGAATLRLESIRDGVNLSAVSDDPNPSIGNIGTCT